MLSSVRFPTRPAALPRGHWRAGSSPLTVAGVRHGWAAKEGGAWNQRERNRRKPYWGWWTVLAGLLGALYLVDYLVGDYLPNFTVIQP